MEQKDAVIIRSYLAQLIKINAEIDRLKQQAGGLQIGMEYVWKSSWLEEYRKKQDSESEIPELFGEDGKINYQILQDGTVKELRGSTPLAIVKEEKILNEV